MVDKLGKKLGKQQAIYEFIKNKGSIEPLSEPLNEPLNLKSRFVTSNDEEYSRSQFVTLNEQIDIKGY